MAESPGQKFSSPSATEGAGAQSAGRPEYESIDLEDIEEAPSSVDAIGSIEEDSIDKILAITDEGWSIDAQRETLKEAAKDPASKHEQDGQASPPRPSAKPSLHIPTPYDFGRAGASPQRAAMPPLPGGPSPIAPPRSVSPPPLPAHRPGSSVRPGAPVSRRPPPLPKSGADGAARAQTVAPPEREAPRVSSEGDPLVELLTTRIDRLTGAEDRVGLARAHLELAIVHETLGDDAKVDAEVAAALEVDPDLAPAHGILRRRLHQRTQLAPMLGHLEREIAVASGEAAAAELLVERARLLVASERTDDAREAWELVLGHAPHHAAALKGLETDLGRRVFVDRGGATASKGPTGADGRVPTTDAERWEDLVAHLGRMADAYAAQPELAAWLHVERARLLEHRLGRVDAARGAFERALRLVGGVGPIRDAFTLHCAAHHDSARLAALLAEEAHLEPSSSRCARLELDAATLTHTLLGDDEEAITLLERAAARAPTTPSVDRRVLDDLVRLYEASGRWPEAARTRRARLRFFTDTPTQVYELERLSTIEERLGDIEGAIGDIERARELDPDDATLVEELDRLLALAGKEDARIALWHREALRAEEGKKRARALSKAAQLAEGLGRNDEALRLLRAAWVAAPGDSEILDPLSRLMSPAPTEAFDRDVRGRIELYAQAAQATRDAGRRVAYLEKVAVLWEELVGDPRCAMRTFEEILRLEPGRRSAVLGLERTAGRVGDDLALSRALEGEAKLAEDGADVLGLRVRSAQVLARVDPARAASLVHAILEQDPRHVAARALETRLHEEAGRWELATQSIKARLDIAATTKDKVALWLELARIYDVRLRDPKSAVEALQEARKADPIHPVPPEEIARVLEAAGDAKALRASIAQLSQDAITPQERARHLARAAEIDELRLMDDRSAATLYARALDETPEDELIADRLVRVLARRVVTTTGAPTSAGGWDAGPTFEAPAFQELLAELTVRAEKATPPSRAQAYSFLLASLLVVADVDLPRARGILDAILEGDPRHVGALRLLEAIARRGPSAQPIASALEQQSAGFTDVRARLGALWELASLEAWRLSSGDSVGTYTRILELDPTDPSALEAAVRLALAPARRGEVPARRAAIAALRSLSARAHDEATRIANDLRLGLLLEAHAMDPTTERDAMSRASRESLERLREVLTLDPLSVTAATSLARVANRLGDASAAVAAAISLAELSVQPAARAKYLVDAANLLLGDASEEALGPMDERTERAAQLLEKALDADPNATAAAALLSQVREAQRRSERLIGVFRGALARATAKDAIVFIGTEIARVARDVIGEIGVAIEAMRAVRAATPDHVPALLTLSELFIAQRAWPEALETLDDIVARGKEPAPRITALFALASIYSKILNNFDKSEHALRTALAIEPENPRAIRALVHRLAAKRSEARAGTTPEDKTATKREIAGLLERLAYVETDRHVQCDILLELADIHVAIADRAQAEKALVEAVAIAPDHGHAFARLARFFCAPQSPGPGGLDAVSYARALGAVIGRGQQLGTSDPRWYGALGRVEVEHLNRLRDGVVHLQRAVQMGPNLHEYRFELASALARLGAHDDASKTVLSMITPNATPLVSISDPAAALELLERAFNAEHRQEEAIVVSEVRAIAGELDDARHAWLRARRLPPFEQHHAVLDRSTLVGHVVPPEGRHLLLDVAAAISGIETRLLRADIGEIGLSARDRIGKRSKHPTRLLLDRLARALGLADVELVVTPNVARTRVLAHDGLWIIVPEALTVLPEPAQLASMGRALARIALNVPWLEELPPAHIEAMLVAAARAVDPTFGADDVDALSLKLVAQYEPNVAKELSRKQKQALEKLTPLMSTAAPSFGNARGGRLVPIDVLIGALARAELRIAYLLTGDVLATIDELRGLDSALLQATASPGRGAIAAVLAHPFAGDVVRFALTPEATALRRRVGSTWAA